MDILLLRAFASAGMCSPSRCLGMGLYVTIRYTSNRQPSCVFGDAYGTAVLDSILPAKQRLAVFWQRTCHTDSPLQMSSYYRAEGVLQISLRAITHCEAFVLNVVLEYCQFMIQQKFNIPHRLARWTPAKFVTRSTSASVILLLQHPLANQE
jgi:hypothetical protein